MKTKSFFGIFVGMAIVPLVAAYAVLKLGWYTPGATAKGQFVEREIQLYKNVEQANENRLWRIVVQPNDQCSQHCQELLYGLNQTYIALGKLQKRVEAQVLSKNLDISAYPKLTSGQHENQHLSPNYLYLVDPFGKVILQYPIGANRAQTVASSKAALADIKKLLKYSRVG